MGHGQIKQLQPKKNPISDDYRLTGSVLGLGINGKVHECYSRATQQKYALKVRKKNLYTIVVQDPLHLTYHV